MTRRMRHLIVALLASSVVACGSGEATPEASGEGDGAPALPAQGIYGRAPAAVGGVPSVILLTVADGMSMPEEAAASITIDQFGLTFSPTRVIARAGTPIAFTNSESAVAHNVRVRALTGTVDILDADANPGERLTAELTAAGGYDVLCDMHPGMTAFIFVSDAHRSVFAETDGTYVLDDIEPGMYTIQLWTTVGGFHEAQSIEVTAGSTGIDLVPSV